MPRTRPIPLTLCVLVLYALHQDLWFWRSARPLVFGFVPVGLAYHAVFCLVTVVLMAVLVRYAWPESLEAEVEGREAASPRERSR
jgi:hypothetical protein